MLQPIDLKDHVHEDIFWDIVDFNNALEEANANADEYEFTGRFRQIYVNRFMFDAESLEDWIDSRASFRMGFSMF